MVPFEGKDMGISETAPPTQRYMPLPKGASYLMSAHGKSARVIKRTVDSNGNPTSADPIRFRFT